LGKFAILARRYNAVTLNDMLFARYQSRLLVWLASLSLLVAFVGMTVQFIGARLLETAAAGIPYETGLLIFGISIALYTAFGGLSRQRAQRHDAGHGDADRHDRAAGGVVITPPGLAMR
jgi:sodium/pantothenate symporter